MQQLQQKLLEAQAEQMAQRGFAGSNLLSSGAVHSPDFGGGVYPHIAAAPAKAANEAQERKLQSVHFLAETDEHVTSDGWLDPSSQTRWNSSFSDFISCFMPDVFFP